MTSGAEESLGHDQAGPGSGGMLEKGQNEKLASQLAEEQVQRCHMSSRGLHQLITETGKNR